MLEDTAAAPGASIDGLRIRFSQAGDEPAMLDLLTRAFDGWPNVDIDVPPIEYLRWKMSSHPVASQLHVVAEVDGKVIGLWLMGVQRYKLRDRVLLCRRGIETCVDPAYRNRGVMKAIRESTREKFRELVDFRLGGQTSNKQMLDLVQREPFDVLGNTIETLRRPLTLRAALSRFRLRKLARPGSFLRALHAYRTSTQREDTAWTVREAAAFDERSDELWREASQQFEFAGVRDQSFLTWRYADPRARRYTILLAEQGGALLGYAVLRARHGRGDIGDLLALPGRTDVARSLVREAVRRFRASGLDWARCWLPAQHPYQDVLAGEGFLLRKPRKIPFLVGPLRIDRSELAFLTEPAARVHLTMGDSEVF
jgi:GNAT superfamily N-acetyltransferase